MVAPTCLDLTRTTVRVSWVSVPDVRYRTSGGSVVRLAPPSFVLSKVKCTSQTMSGGSFDKIYPLVSIFNAYSKNLNLVGRFTRRSSKEIPLPGVLGPFPIVGVTAFVFFDSRPVSLPYTWPLTTLLGEREGLTVTWLLHWMIFLVSGLQTRTFSYPFYVPNHDSTLLCCENILLSLRYKCKHKWG